jgi:hypothetical protein
LKNKNRFSMCFAILVICLTFAGCSTLASLMKTSSGNSSANTSGLGSGYSSALASNQVASISIQSSSTTQSNASSAGSSLNYFGLTIFGNFLSSINSGESIEFNLENTSNNNSLNGFQIKLPAQYTKDFTIPTGANGNVSVINGEYVWSFPNQYIAANQSATVTITLTPNSTSFGTITYTSLPFDFYMSDGKTKISTVNVI